MSQFINFSPEGSHLLQEAFTQGQSFSSVAVHMFRPESQTRSVRIFWSHARAVKRRAKRGGSEKAFKMVPYPPSSVAKSTATRPRQWPRAENVSSSV